MARLMIQRISNMLVGVFRFFIWIYRHSFSLFIGRRCRFEPSCSVYADEALKRYGLVVGGKLALRRIFRCGPFGGFGYDPVPDLRLPKDKK